MVWKFCTRRKLRLMIFRWAVAFVFVSFLFGTLIALHQPYRGRDFSMPTKEGEAVTGSARPLGQRIAGGKSPRFIYLIQTEKCLPPEILDSQFLGSSALCSCEVLVLSYKSLCLNNAHLHVRYTFEEITWSEGRNKLFELAKKRASDQALYFMFLDDDIRLIFNDFTPRALRARAPARVFEEFLLRHEPAIGVPDYDKHHGASVMISKRKKLCGRNVTNKKRLYIPTVHFDASFTAIHRNASDYLLPYPTIHDSTCFWHSQRYMIAAAEIQFRGQVVMFIPVRGINTEHRQYPRDDSGAREVWARFVKELVKRVPAAYRDRKMLKEFQADPEKYTENSLSVCLNVPTKYPIQPFRHFTWNLQNAVP